MPPRAVGRRSTRVASVEADSHVSSPSPSPQPILTKPKLPRLTGTPASRRQYTYGSAVEPPPKRPGRGMSADEPQDLGNAVGNVLSRHIQEDEDAQRRMMPPPPRPSSEVMDADELAGGTTQSPRKGRGTPRRTQRKGAGAQRAESVDSQYDNHMYDTRTFSPMPPSTNGQEDIRDDRSFVTESDFYGDATIASSPRVTPPVSNTKPTRNSSQPKPSNLRNVRQPSPVLEDPEDVDDGEPELLPSEPEPQPEPEPEPEPEPQQPEPEPRRLDPISSQPSVEPELDDDFRQAAFGPQRNVNTPAPNGQHLRKPPRRGLRGSSLSNAGTPSKPSAPPQMEEVGDIRKASSNLLSARMGGIPSLPAPGLFSSPAKRGGRQWTRTNEEDFATNHSEADDAIQREIEASEVGSVDEEHSPWRDRWLKVKAMSPFKPSSREQLQVEEDTLEPTDEADEPSYEDRSFEEPSFEDRSFEQEEDFEGGNGIDWWSLFRPRTYLDPVLRVTDSIIFFILQMSKAMWNAIDVQQILSWVAMVTMACGILLFASRTDLNLDLPDLSEYSLPSVPISPVSGLKSFAGKVGDFAYSIPIPSFTFGSDDSIWELDESTRYKVEDFLKKYEKDFKTLKKSGKLHAESLAKLEKVVPKVVHMELKNGKPVVAQEFWHAIRDLLRDDGSFLTVDKKGNDYTVSSDAHWKAIAKKLVGDPAFTSKLNFSMDGIEDRINTKMASFWDNWIKDNDHKISDQLGSALEKLKSAASERELNDVVKKLVKEHVPDPNAQGVLVTRDEFLRHLQNEFATHRSEIRAELRELQPQLEELIRESVELVADKTTTPPSGMTRDDVTSLVNNLLRKALADANLEAMARGKIHAHWDIELKNQVNYFSLGAGAIADARHSSKTYDPYKQGVIDDDAYAKGLRGARPLPPSAALMPWLDEGDCWCAARQTNYRGNPHGAAISVLLGHQITPQHIVIEHILPGATTDPGARPREIEVHARIEDPSIRERARDFSATHFPERDPSTEDWDATPADLGPQFVKVGQFVYEGAELHDGVHVHRLSSELMAMGVETDQVVVRATSNYGARNHTCFYRVRLYGHRRGVDPE